MFDTESRYATIDTYVVANSAGHLVRIVKIRFIPVTPGLTTRTVTGADRGDLVSYQYYKSADRFWRIADANVVLDPADVFDKPGRVIDIPTSS